MKELQNHLVVIINIVGFVITLTIIQGVAVAQKDAAELLLRDRVALLTHDLAMRLALREDQTRKVQDILAGLQERATQADREIQKLLDPDQTVRYGKLKGELLGRLHDKRSATSRKEH